MDDWKSFPLPARLGHFEFGRGRNGVRMRGPSAMSDITTRSHEFESFKAPMVGALRARHSYDLRLMTPAPADPPSALPPIGFSISSRPPTTSQAVDFDGYNFWKQYQNPVRKKSSFFQAEPGAETPARTTFEIMYTRRQTSPKTIHSMHNPKPLPVARQILPDDPKSADERMLPSIDRDKMTKLPSKFGKSKKLLEANVKRNVSTKLLRFANYSVWIFHTEKAAGIFYTDGEVQHSKTDMKYWNSLNSLWGKDFSRKRDLGPTQPTEMNVSYFNGGAPASPKRKNRRTCMSHVRGDSSSVNFNNSQYGRDDQKNYI